MNPDRLAPHGGCNHRECEECFPERHYTDYKGREFPGTFQQNDSPSTVEKEWDVQLQTVCLTCSVALINKEEPIANKHFTHLIIVVPNFDVVRPVPIAR